MEKRKLYIFTQQYPYERGEKTFIEPELKALVQSNKFDITIITNGRKGKNKIFTVDECVKCRLIPLVSLVKRPFLAVKYGFQFLFSKKTRAERKAVLECSKCWGKFVDSLLLFLYAQMFYYDISRLSIDLNDAILYTYWYNIQTLAIALHKQEWKDIRLISRIHGYDLYDERAPHGRQPFRTFIKENLDKLFFVGKTGLDYYAQKEGNSYKYVLNYLGTINRDQYEAILNSQNSYEGCLIVSCSNIIPLKRINLIIEAMSLITEFDIKWVHFGDGSDREKIEQLSREKLGQKENVTYFFKGQTPNEEIMSFYKNNNIDCFITTTESEGCPVSIQEAMSYGIPIIATAVAEIPLMVKGNGILLKKNPDIVEIKEAIIEIYTLAEERKKHMRNQSRQLWEKYFNGDRNHKEFIQYLLEL